jgi:hypothetical protein
LAIVEAFAGVGRAEKKIFGWMNEMAFLLSNNLLAVVFRRLYGHSGQILRQMPTLFGPMKSLFFLIFSLKLWALTLHFSPRISELLTFQLSKVSEMIGIGTDSSGKHRWIWGEEMNDAQGNKYYTS